MPNSKKKKKNKSPKFKKEVNQPVLKNYMSTPLTDQKEIKKRTPPSPEDTPAKKLNMSNEEAYESQIGKENDVTMESEVSDNSTVDTEDSNHEKSTEGPKAGKEGEMDDETESIMKKLKHMERRMTASFEKMIEKALKPLREDIRKLSTTKLQHEEKIKQVDMISKENKELKDMMLGVQAENRKLKDKLNSIENKLLENNFVIMGVNEDAWETYTTLCDKVYQIIAYTVNAQDPQIQIQNAKKAKLVKVKRLGAFSKNRGRPISIQFEHYSAGQYFWENKGYLPDGVYVKREYTEETERVRRILKPVYNAAKNSTAYKGRCRMEGNHLVIQGKKYGLHNLQELPDDLSGHKVTSRSTNLVLGFLGELHPLSNFHRCNFTEGGLRFNSGEQYIQYTKAYYYENMELAGRILNTEKPLDCKRLSREIRYPSDKGRWSEIAKEMCYRGLKVKFEQNENLKQFLIHTGNKTIVESSMDKLWGTGVPLYVKNCLDPKAWTSQGLLGEILTEIRMELHRKRTLSSSNEGTLV